MEVNKNEKNYDDQLDFIGYFPNKWAGYSWATTLSWPFWDFYCSTTIVATAAPNFLSQGGLPTNQILWTTRTLLQ
jgi:hypothetical protein